MAMYKTTKADFSEFKAECDRWISHFGLLDWEVCYTHDGDSDDTRATCYPDYEARIVILTLGTEWTMKPEKHEVKMIAFHEVCELLLSPLSLAADNRYTTKGTIIAAIHSIIRRLENTVFKDGE